MYENRLETAVRQTLLGWVKLEPELSGQGRGGRWSPSQVTQEMRVRDFLSFWCPFSHVFSVVSSQFLSKDNHGLSFDDF